MLLYYLYIGVSVHPRRPSFTVPSQPAAAAAAPLFDNSVHPDQVRSSVSNDQGPSFSEMIHAIANTVSTDTGASAASATSSSVSSASVTCSPDTDAMMGDTTVTGKRDLSSHLAPSQTEPGLTHLGAGDHQRFEQHMGRPNTLAGSALQAAAGANAQHDQQMMGNTSVDQLGGLMQNNEAVWDEELQGLTPQQQRDLIAQRESQAEIQRQYEESKKRQA